MDEAQAVAFRSRARGVGVLFSVFSPTRSQIIPTPQPTPGGRVASRHDVLAVVIRQRPPLLERHVRLRHREKLFRHAERRGAAVARAHRARLLAVPPEHLRREQRLGVPVLGLIRQPLELFSVRAQLLRGDVVRLRRGRRASLEERFHASRVLAPIDEPRRGDVEEEVRELLAFHERLAVDAYLPREDRIQLRQREGVEGVEVIVQRDVAHALEDVRARGPERVPGGVQGGQAEERRHRDRASRRGASPSLPGPSSRRSSIINRDSSFWPTRSRREVARPMDFNQAVGRVHRSVDRTAMKC
eukprot:31167-Pelagococcus_subviridis.AAC.1